MMMVYPELFAESNRITTVLSNMCLENYNHLIEWRNQPSIMEIGYGDGGTSQKSFFPHLPSNMKEFVAIDVSPSVIEYARKNTALPSMKFDELDIATDEIPTKYLGRFDHIFAFWVIHSVKDPRQAFRNMHKMLKPGGKIFLTFCETTTIDHALDELLNHPEWGKYVDKSLISPYFYSPNARQQWEKNLNETGFKNHEFFEKETCVEFLDDNEFDSLLISHITFLPNIPENELENFKTMYRELTRRGKLVNIQVRDGKEIISWKFKVFIVSATKT